MKTRDVLIFFCWEHGTHYFTDGDARLIYVVDIDS